MVRRLILAVAVLFCFSSHCEAEAVRKLPVVVPFEAKNQGREKQRQVLLEENARLRQTLQLRIQRQLWLKLQREENQNILQRLQHQHDELMKEINN